MSVRLKIRIVVASFILIGFFTPLFSQNAFYEALPLSQIDKNEIGKFKTLLTGDILTASEKEQLKKLISFWQDPWLYVKTNDSVPIGILKIVEEKLSQKIKDYREQNDHKSADEVTNLKPAVNFHFLAPAQTPAPKTIPSNFMNKTFQTNLIDALGTVIAQRFKEDVTTIYITKFKKELGATDVFKRIKVLLPKTANMIIKDDPFSYFSLGSQWKIAFQNDLDHLPENLVKYIKKFYPKIAAGKLFPYLEMAALTGGKLLQGYHLTDIIGYLDVKFKLEAQQQGAQQEIYKKIHEDIHFIDLFQENLQRLDNNNTFNSWIDFNQLAQLVDTENGMSYFLALVYLQDKDFFDNKTVTLDNKTHTLTELLKDSGNFFKNHVFPAYQDLVALAALDNKSPAGTEEMVNYLQHVVNIFKNVYTIFKPQGKSLVLEILQGGVDLYRCIVKKEYYKIIAGAFYVLEQLTAKDKKFHAALMKFAEFIEGLAGAKTADEMRGVISGVVLPPGGFMAKRTSKFSFTITAHPGLFAGAEKAIKHQTNEPDWGFSYGFTAPVGFELCWGSRKPKFISSLGVFATLVDLGAVVSYRLPQSDQYSGLPDSITLKQVFSPGLSLNLGLKNSPITVGLGLEYTPELRKITEESGNDIKANTWLYYLRVSWDLPLINILGTRFK